MITYLVTGEDDGDGYLVVVKETGVVICWCATRNAALAVANERASLAPGNRVESDAEDYGDGSWREAGAEWAS